MINIRPYQITDKIAVKAIASATAFFGNPVYAFMDDGNLFWDAFYNYFFEYERSTCWVAERDNSIIGFLAGSLDYLKQQKVIKRIIAPQILTGITQRKYSIHKKTITYVWLLLIQSIFYPAPHIDYERYKANLHINIVPEARGKGVGKALLVSYHHQIKSYGITGIHLHTTNLNTAACHLYQKIGYQLLNTWPSLVWQKILNEKIENRCYGIIL